MPLTPQSKPSSPPSAETPFAGGYSPFPEKPHAGTEFRLRRLFFLLILFLAAIILFTYHPEDLDYIDGGIAEPGYPYNWFGAIGANLAWFALALLGVAVYPLLLMTVLCCIRRLVWRKHLLEKNWCYVAAIPMTGLGFSLLFGVWPNAFPALTAMLNIQKIPGGVIGRCFSAPGGVLQSVISGKGCAIIALLLLAVSIGTIIQYDWWELDKIWWERLRNATTKALAVYRAWREERRRNAAEKAEKIRQSEPPAAKETPAEQFPPPRPSITPPVPPTVGPAGFAGRRGQDSINDALRRVEAVTGGTRQQPVPPPVPNTSGYTQPDLPVPQIKKPSEAQSDLPIYQPIICCDGYRLPFFNDFYKPAPSEQQDAASEREITENSAILQRTLDEFGLDATVESAISGPQVTLYKISMPPGVQLSRLGALRENISMALKARRAIRMLLPIPGEQFAGIEVPNNVRKTVSAHELFGSAVWQKNAVNDGMNIPLMLGKNIMGEVCMLDLQKSPHLLIAGATGSGKSVCMNLMIQSMLLKFRPDELQLIMFDPKFLEFSPYSRIPHLISPIINEPDDVGEVLNWACAEMDRRYKLIAAAGERQLRDYNRRTIRETILDADGNPIPDRLPYIVIIIDELADIMARAKKEVEIALARLAGKARAAGIHMIVATQRPSSDVITGVIKSNFPQRIALQVTDQINSRVILDDRGAENLLGMGDMLCNSGSDGFSRIQCGWVTNSEIAGVADFCADQLEQSFNESLQKRLEALHNARQEAQNRKDSTLQDNEPFNGNAGSQTSGKVAPAKETDSTEVLVAKALSALRISKRPTISYLQRALGIGYNKSASLMDELEERGYVGPQPQSGSREIFFENFPPEEIPVEPSVPAAPSPADDTPDNDLPADTKEPHDDDTAELPSEETNDR